MKFFSRECACQEVQKKHQEQLATLQSNTDMAWMKLNEIFDSKDSLIKVSLEMQSLRDKMSELNARITRLENRPKVKVTPAIIEKRKPGRPRKEIAQKENKNEYAFWA